MTTPPNPIMTTTEIQSKIAEPPVERPNYEDDPSKRVFVGILHRGEQSFPGEASLSLCKTKVNWEINLIGNYSIAIDNLAFNTTNGLSPKECELLQFWTTKGLNWLLGK